MIFQTKSIADQTLEYLAKWRENPVLWGYYQYIQQSYNQSLSPLVHVYPQYEQYRDEYLSTRFEPATLNAFLRDFKLPEAMKNNVDLMWQAQKKANPQASHQEILVSVFHSLWPLMVFEKMTYSEVMSYLTHLESYVQTPLEKGTIWSFRYEIANYFKDSPQAHLALVKYFEDPAHHQAVSDVERLEIEYFLKTIEHKGDLKKTAEMISVIQINPNEEFLFCSEFLNIFKLEHALEIQENTYSGELVTRISTRLNDLKELHQHMLTSISAENNLLSKMFIQKTMQILQMLGVYFLDSISNKNVFSAVDWKGIRQAYEQSGHEGYVTLLEEELKKILKSVLNVILPATPKHAINEKFEEVYLVFSKNIDLIYRYQALFGYEVRLMRQDLFIKSLTNYLELKKTLISKTVEMPLDVKAIQLALTKKIFPNQTSTTHHQVYAMTVYQLISASRFREALALTYAAEAIVQRQVIQLMDKENNYLGALFLFFYYYKKDFLKAMSYEKTIIKTEPEWASQFLFLKYINHTELSGLEIGRLSDWINAPEVTVAPFMFDLLQKENHLEMVEFIAPLRDQINKRFKVIEFQMQNTEPQDQKSTDIDVLQGLWLQEEKLQESLPKLEEASLEEQLFQNHTKSLLQPAEVIWDLNQLAVDHPLSQLIDRVAVKVKKEQGQADIHLVFHCGGLEIKARLNAYDQFIVEQNGHSHYEIYEALKSLLFTLFNQKYLPALKTAEAHSQKEAKQKLFQQMVYPKIMKQKLFQEYENLKKVPFEVIHSPDQNPFEADFFVKETNATQTYFRPVYAGDPLLQSKTQPLFQIRWIEPHFRAVTNGEIKEKQLELYVQYQIREMIRKNHPLFTSQKITDKDDYLLYLLDEKIMDPNLKPAGGKSEFEFPLKSIKQTLNHEEIELIKRPTTFVSGYFKVYAISDF